MSDEDIFPAKPPIVRRPRSRPAAPPSDFDDPAVRARARTLHAASIGRLDGLAECTDPPRCQIGDHAHWLAIGGPRPTLDERRVSHRRTWEWDAAGLAWKCVAVHGHDAPPPAA